jgi:hypothetical protein
MLMILPDDVEGGGRQQQPTEISRKSQVLFAPRIIVIALVSSSKIHSAAAGNLQRV